MSSKSRDSSSSSSSTHFAKLSAMCRKE